MFFYYFSSPNCFSIMPVHIFYFCSRHEVLNRRLHAFFCSELCKEKTDDKLQIKDEKRRVIDHNLDIHCEAIWTETFIVSAGSVSHLKCSKIHNETNIIKVKRSLLI